MIRRCGPSRSFPEAHPFLDAVEARPDVLLVIGHHEREKAQWLSDAADAALVMVELGTECLGVYAGEAFGEEGSNILGFARYRLGDEPPGQLVELVVQPRTTPSAIMLARALLRDAGLDFAMCRDAPGRILDALLRPYLNAALTRLDDGLASREGLDRAIELGLGHARGPIRLLEGAGLAEHYEISEALHRAHGGKGGFAPARRAQVAHAIRRHASNRS